MSISLPEDTPDTKPEIRHVRATLGLIAIAALALAGACDSTTSPEEALSGRLVPTDTAVLLGQSVPIQATIQYPSGSRAPDSVVWSLSDSTRLELSVTGPGQASVKALTRGTAYVIALMNEVFTDSTEVRVDLALDGTLLPEQASIFLAEETTVEAEVEYWSGPGLPDTVDWSISDDAVLELMQTQRGEATVKGIGRGTAYLLALMNGEFEDSVEVRVGDVGDLRWVVEGAGSQTVSGPSLDAAGRIYTVRFEQAPGNLTVVNPDGTVAYSVPACFADLAGSVMSDGTVYTTRGRCLQRNAPDGSFEWSVPMCGTSWSGVAVDDDRSAVCVDASSDENEGRVVTRISGGGAEVWRTLLDGSGIMDWRAAPVIASSGKIYIGWKDSAWNGYLSRVSSDGTLDWTIQTDGGLELSNPALFEDRIVLTFFSGAVAVYDTTGVLQWQVDGATSGRSDGDPSSPAVDAAGNIYVQSWRRLRSFDRDGNLRWEADTLRVTSSWGSSAPALLSDNRLVVLCATDPGVNEICVVNNDDGSLVWRTSLGRALYGSVAVSPEGVIYASDQNDLVAVWGRTPPLTAGWPTDGGSMQRLRRQ